MAAIFITATGTDIGKTYLTCGLIRHLRARGQPVAALKPVASGFDHTQPETTDSGLLLKALGQSVSAEEIARVSPWRFAASLSPDLAAAREVRTIDFDALVEFSRKAARDHCGTLLIEGIGGVMVPLDARHTVLDWIAALGVPAMVVAGSYLGSLSHTLTCLDVLRRRDVALRAIVVNESVGSTVTVNETVETVSRFAHPIPVMCLRRADLTATEADISQIAVVLD